MRKHGARKVDGAKEKKKGKHHVSDDTKVAHDMENIDYGMSEVMVLQDSNILDEDGNIQDVDDTLHNVRMTDKYKDGVRDAIKNQKDYDPTKDKQDMLEKYDDPMAAQPKGFVMGQVKEVRICGGWGVVCWLVFDWLSVGSRLDGWNPTLPQWRARF